MLDRLPRPAPTVAPDMMSELLMGMRLNGIFYRRMRLTAPFGIGFGGAPGKASAGSASAGAA